MKIENRMQDGVGSFVASEDGDVVGRADCRVDPIINVITIAYVGVFPQYRGSGKAKEIVTAVADYARTNGLKVRPVCSYARAVFERDHSLKDVMEL